MTLEPINDNIVVQVENNENGKTTKGGIYIPKSADNSKPDSGCVVSVGRGRILNNGEVIAPSVKIGDNIIFNRFAGIQINDNDNVYLIIKENDILAKLH